MTSRRRDSKNWNFTSVAKVFQHSDEKEMMRIREIVVRVQRAVQKMNLSLEELFERCDLNHDGSIAETELASAFEQLGIVKSISIEDAKLIMRYADRNDDHSISLTEFLSQFSSSDDEENKMGEEEPPLLVKTKSNTESSSETSTDDRETISKQRSHRFFQRSKTLSTTILLTDLIGAFGDIFFVSGSGIISNDLSVSTNEAEDVRGVRWCSSAKHENFDYILKHFECPRNKLEHQRSNTGPTIAVKGITLDLNTPGRWYLELECCPQVEHVLVSRVRVSLQKIDKPWSR